MRDKKRIKRMLKLIEKIWLENPDLRLGQLLSNTYTAYEKDIYFAEDSELETRLKITYKEAL